MRYGYFDDARQEYVIDRPGAPVSMTNYLGTQRMSAAPPPNDRTIYDKPDMCKARIKKRLHDQVSMSYDLHLYSRKTHHRGYDGLRRR